MLEAAGYDSESDPQNPTGSVFCSHGAGYPVPWYEVEEKMHVPLSGKAEGRRRELAGESEENILSEEEIIAQAKAKAQKLRQEPERAYDGYGGLEKDLEEIFVREFGEIRRPGAQEQKQTVCYEKEQRIAAAREEYMGQHQKKWGLSQESRNAAGKKKEYFLVDGYNVIYAWPDLGQIWPEPVWKRPGESWRTFCVIIRGMWDAR